jgi:lipoic acid synthetase
MQEVKKYLSQFLNNHFKPEIRNTKYERRLPDWLRRPMPSAGEYSRTSDIVNSLGLETICTNANCPNRGDCWSRGTATVLILGNICTRGCKFCSVAKGKPDLPDSTEPRRIAELAKKLDLHYLVITSVNRDDLPDGGAAHFRDCISEVRSRCPAVKIEILTPDFRDCQNEAIEILAQSSPFVFAHNVETVPSLYPLVRGGGDYQLSLNLFKLAKNRFPDTPAKSSIMLGLGETDNEVEQVLNDLHSVGCDRLTIGQYLKPSKHSLDVVEYITPEKFDWWWQRAAEFGFDWVISAPFARSSYFAETTFPQGRLILK